MADYELLLHDKRKYTEMLRYLGYRTAKELGDKDVKAHGHQPDELGDLCTLVDNDSKTKGERMKKTDNHSLKAVFVDQVDIHTGEGISIMSIVSRWPTLIADFMRLDDSYIEPGAVMKKLDISIAEAVVLVTKNKLFVEWKNLFLPELLSRYVRILELANSRKKTMDEYREWVKPYVARHKLIEEGLSRPENRSIMRTSFMTPVGHALSFASIEAWVWKDFISSEIYKVAGDIFARNPVDVYDNWTKKNLIFSNDYGLAVKHPWITYEWVKDKKTEIYRDGWLNKNRYYYSFFVVKFMRTNMRTATGDELEDGQFDVNLIVMSQNAMFVKLLELKAKQEEFNKYVDNILGIPHYIKGSRPAAKNNNTFQPVKKFFDTFSIPLKFSKKGPYERDWDERITKYYFAPIAGDRYVPIVNFIKQKIGYGK